MSLRGCFPYSFEGLIEYNEQENKFSGILGAMFISFLQTFKNQLNLTIEIQAKDLGVGAYKDDLKRYDGCMGEIQINRSDIILQMNPYPMDIENVSQGVIFYETSLMFISMYSKVELGGSMQLLKSVSAFSQAVWYLCALTCLLLSMMLALETGLSRWARESSKSKPQSPLYQVMIHCLRFGQMDDGGPQRRLIFMTASLFSLLVIHYFCTMIKTELVVIKDPLVFKSYDDIIQRGAIPLFVKGMTYDSLFRDARATPNRKRLWKYGVESFGEKRLYMQLSPLLYLLGALSLLKQKAIVVLDEALIPVVSTSGCSLAGRDVSRLPLVSKLLKNEQEMRQLMDLGSIGKTEQDAFFEYARSNDLEFDHSPEALLHMSRDKEEKPYNQGVVFTTHNKKLEKTLVSAMRKVIESGLALEQLASMEKINLFKNHPVPDSVVGRPQRSRRSEVEKCKSKSIIKPILKLQAIKLDNMRSIFILMGAIDSLVLILLAGEIFAAKVTRSPYRQQRMKRASRVSLCVANYFLDAVTRAHELSIIPFV